MDDPTAAVDSQTAANVPTADDLTQVAAMKRAPLWHPTMGTQ